MSKHLSRRVAILLATVVVFAVPLQAQTATSDWSRISSVESGSKLSIKLKNGKTIDGKFNNVSDSMISVKVKNSDQEIRREEVQAVYRVVRKSATKATLIGTGVGAGAGAALGAAGSSGSDFDKLDQAVTAGLVVVGAIVGTVAGYFIGRTGRKKELIYEAR